MIRRLVCVRLIDEIEDAAGLIADVLDAVPDLRWDDDERVTHRTETELQSVSHSGNVNHVKDLGYAEAASCSASW